MQQTLVEGFALGNGLDSYHHELESVRQRLESLHEEITRLIPTALQVADHMQAGWKSCVQLVADGKTDDVHARKERVVAAIEEALRIAGGIYSYATTLVALSQTPVAKTEQLADALRALRRLQNRIVTRWHDPESLEYLVAEELTPTREQFKAMVEKSPYPQAWYDEDSKPF
jgi:hypothetical protein